MKIFWMSIAGAACLILVLLFMPFMLAATTVSRINEAWPPVPVEERIAEATRMSSAALAGLYAPNIAMTVSKDDLSVLLKQAISDATMPQSNPLGLSIQVADPVVAFGLQAATLAAAIKGSMVAGDEWLQFSGAVHGLVTVTMDGADIVLTPAIERVNLDSIEVDEWFWSPSVTTAAANVLFQRFRDNVNGALKPTRIPLDLKPLGTDGQTGAPIAVEVLGRRVELPGLALRGAAVLVDTDGVHVLAEVTPNPTPISPGSPTSNFDRFATDFRARVPAAISGIEWTQTDIAVAPDFLRSWMSPVLPPVKAEERRIAAIRESARDLAALAGPDFGIRFSTDLLKPALTSVAQKAVEENRSKLPFVVEDIALDFEDQQIRVNVAISGTIPETAVSFAGSVEATATMKPGRHGITIVPSFSGLRIDRLAEVRHGIDLTRIATSAAAMVTGGLDNLNAAIPEIPITLDPPQIAAIDLASAARVVPGLGIEPAAFAPQQPTFGRTVVLISPRGVSVLMDIDVAGLPARVMPVGRQGTSYEAYASAFQARWESTFGASDEGHDEAVLAQRRLSEYFNAAWAALNPRLQYRFDTGTLRIPSTSINLLERPSFRCEPEERCEFHSCADNCRRQRCPDCPQISLPFQGHTDEPICAGRKFACDRRADTEYGLCRARCDTEGNINKTACDGRNTVRIARCQAVANLQAALADISGVGNISGEARATGVLSMALPNLIMSPDAMAFVGRPWILADVAVNGAIGFVPYDIIGHALMCPVKGQTPFRVTATLPRQNPVVRADVAVAGSGGNGDLVLRLTLSEVPVAGRIAPAPAEALLAQNPHLAVVCSPVLTGTLAGMTFAGRAAALGGTDVADALRKVTDSDTAAMLAAVFAGDLRHTIPRFAFDVTMPSLAVDLMGSSLRLKPRLGRQGIAYAAER